MQKNGQKITNSVQKVNPFQHNFFGETQNICRTNIRQGNTQYKDALYDKKRKIISKFKNLNENIKIVVRKSGINKKQTKRDEN